MRHTPFHAIAWIAGWDLMRELWYRSTGWWVHLPIDYIEAPIVRMFESWKNIIAFGVTTTGLGPGGEAGGRVISDLIKAGVNGEIDKRTLGNLLWSMAMFTDPHGAFHEIDTYSRTGDPKHLTRLGSMVLLGAHDAANYAPKRPMQLIPDWIMPKSKRVRDAEAAQRYIAGRREFRQQRQQMRPRPQIKERVGD